MSRLRSVIVALVVACGATAPPAHAQTLEPIGLLPSDGSVLGEVGDMDVLPDGRIVVMDVQAHAVLVYSPAGQLLQTLGGEGQGPGEIGLSVEVEVGPTGRIMVADAGNARLTLWNSDGTLVGSRSLDGLLGGTPRWPHELVWQDSLLLLRVAAFTPGAPAEVFSLPPDLEGEAHRIATVPTGDGGVTCDFCPMAVDPGGSLVFAKGDTAYVIRRLDADGTVVREWTRGDLPAARRSAAERQRLDAAAHRIAGAEGGAAGTGDFSEFKTRFSPHGLDFDDAGRLWALPRTEEGATASFDVFSASGPRLGAVDVDAPLVRFRIRGTRLIASSENAMGEPVVRVFEIRE